jgi:hypothetical protein
MKTEFEILERYQNSDEVKTLVAAVEDGTPEEHDAAVTQLMGIENKAMLESGAKYDGQQDLANAMFFDFLMDDKAKIVWLEQCTADQSERIAYLKEKINFSKTESATHK